MCAERVYVVEGVTVFGLLSEVLGIVASVVSAIVTFLLIVELATMLFSTYMKQRILYH